MNDQAPREQPLPPKAEHLPTVDARQAQVTGRLRYMLAVSAVLVVVAFAISSTPRSVLGALHIGAVGGQHDDTGAGCDVRWHHCAHAIRKHRRFERA